MHCVSHPDSHPNVSLGIATTPDANQVASKPPHRKYRELSPQEVQRIASGLRHHTKVAAANALREFAVAARPELVDAVLSRADEIARLRHQRADRRPVPVVPIEVRLRKVKSQRVLRVAKSLFRHAAAGGGSFKVQFVERSDDVSYSVVIDFNRDTYAGQFKGWRATEDHHVIRVPLDWGTRVSRRRLASLDGMMTLDAHRLVAPHGVELYAAVWAAQGRGYTVNVHRGYIAVSAGYAYHGETAEAALAGVRRKRKAAENPGQYRRTSYEVDVEEFIRRHKRYSRVSVGLDDARETGSCEYGIRSWCDAVGLDYARGEASMDDVLEAFRGRPQVEVRRAVLHAVRRHRQQVTRGQ